jgi:hypothetical protein
MDTQKQLNVPLQGRFRSAELDNAFRNCVIMVFACAFGSGMLLVVMVTEGYFGDGISGLAALFHRGKDLAAKTVGAGNG